MASDMELTSEQLDSLKRLHIAASEAAALVDDAQPLDWRLGTIAKDSEQALLIASGYPPKWEQQMDREAAGTPLKGLFGWGLSGRIRSADIMTLEELSAHTEDSILAIKGVGPRAIRKIADTLKAHDLEFTEKVA
jgi:hypothetical protein